MLLIILGAAAAVSPPPAPAPRAQARATVRIERAGIASREQWTQVPLEQHKEVVRRDERGRPVLIRIVDFE